MISKIVKNRILLYFFYVAVLVSIAAYVQYRLFLSDAGICEDTGRVLDGDELKREAFLNYVYQSTVFFADKAVTFGDGGVRFGIIKDINEEGFKSRMIHAAQSSGSIEQRFSIELIDLREVWNSNHGFHEELKTLRDPFGFVIYSGSSSRPDGQIYFSNEFEEVSSDRLPGGDYKASVLERIMGFGNHYFRVGFRGFLLGCCGGKKTLNGYDTLDSSLKVFKATSSSSAQGLKTISVSNCGNVLDEASESHHGFREIKWIRWR